MQQPVGQSDNRLSFALFTRGATSCPASTDVPNFEISSDFRAASSCPSARRRGWESQCRTFFGCDRPAPPKRRTALVRPRASSFFFFTVDIAANLPRATVAINEAISHYRRLFFLFFGFPALRLFRCCSHFARWYACVFSPRGAADVFA